MNSSSDPSRPSSLGQHLLRRTARHRYRTARRLASLALAVLCTAVLADPPAAGQSTPNLRIRIAIASDGTTPFAASAGPGRDTEAHNGIVDTQDTVLYRIDWSVNHAPADDLAVRSTLPVGMSWVALPGVCQTSGVHPASAISADSRTLVCALGRQAGGQTGAVDANALVGSLRNGTRLGVSAGLSARGAARATSTTVTVTASAGPKADLVMTHIQNQLAENVLSSNGTSGRLFWYPITVEVGGSGKGAEPLRSRPLSFDIDFSAVAAQIPSWTFGSASRYKIQTPEQSVTRCGPNPWSMLGQPFGQPGGVNGATLVNSAVNSGTWTCRWDAATKRLTVTIAGADLAPSTFPTQDGLSQPLPLTEKVIVSGAVAMWGSDANLISILSPNPGTPPGNGTLPSARATWIHGPVGISGGAAPDDRSNNTYAPSYNYTPPGDFDSYYTDDIGRLTANVGYGLIHAWQLLGGIPNYPQYHYFIPTQTQQDNEGDGTIAPDQTYSYTLHIDGSGRASPQRAALCAQLSPGQELVPAAWSDFDYNAVGNRAAYNAGILPKITQHQAAVAVLAGGVKVYDQTPDYSSPGASDLGRHLVIEYSTDAPSYDGNCTDQYTWSTTPPANLAGVRQVRVYTTRPLATNEELSAVVALRAKPGPPGERLFTIGSNRQWGNTAFSGTPPWQTLTTVTGQTWNLNTFCPSPANPTARPNYAYNDCVTLVGGDLDVVKSVVGAQRNLQPGDVVTFKIQAQAAGQTPGVTRDMVVKDTLPAGLSFTGVANVAPTTGGPGATNLEWDLHTVPNGVVRTITYQAVVAGGYTPFEVFDNHVTLDGSIDNGAGATIPLTERSADAAVQAGGAFSRLQVVKSTSTPVIGQNQDFAFRLRYTNSGTDPLGSVDTIDVLPYNGDGRTTPSSFSGTDPLSSITPSASDAQQYVTLAAPARVVVDAHSPTNALPDGSTLWCEVPGQNGSASIPKVGDPGCPATLAEATAVRVVFPDALASGASERITLGFTSHGNKPADEYGNDAGARVAGLKLPAISNESVVVVRGAKLALTKTAGRATVPLGDRLTYTITATDLGPLAEPAGTTIADDLPAGLSFVSASGGGALSGSTVRWTLPAISPGRSVRRTVTVTVQRLGTVINHARVISTPLPAPGRPSAVAPVAVHQPPLADTGVDVGDQLQVAVLAIGVGIAGMVAGTRRRRAG